MSQACLILNSEISSIGIMAEEMGSGCKRHVENKAADVSEATIPKKSIGFLGPIEYGCTTTLGALPAEPLLQASVVHARLSALQPSWDHPQMLELLGLMDESVVNDLYLAAENSARELLPQSQPVEQTRREEADRETARKREEADRNAEALLEKAGANTRVFIGFSLIGGLPFKATEAGIKGMFGKCGKIDKIELPMNAKGRPAGFVFITFVDVASVAKAVEMDGQEMMSRWINVKEADGNDGQPKFGGTPNGAPKPKPEGCTSEIAREHEGKRRREEAERETARKREEADRNADSLLEEIAREEKSKAAKKELRKEVKKLNLIRERAMKREEADRKAEALLEEIAREKTLLVDRKERRKKLKELKAGNVAGMGKWEAGKEEREAGTEEREAGTEDNEDFMSLFNSNLGLNTAAGGNVVQEENKGNEEEKISEDECCVCWTEKKNWIFVPCGHVCVCQGCARDIMKGNRECPLCCQKTTAIFQVFL